MVLNWVVTKVEICWGNCEFSCVFHQYSRVQTLSFWLFALLWWTIATYRRHKSDGVNDQTKTLILKKKILWCGVYLGGKNLSYSRCLEEGVFFGFCGDVRKVRKSVKKEKRKKKGKGDSELGSHKGWGVIWYIILNICFPFLNNTSRKPVRCAW